MLFDVNCAAGLADAFEGIRQLLFLGILFENKNNGGNGRDGTGWRAPAPPATPLAPWEERKLSPRKRG